MSRIDKVQRICRSLARRGWMEVFQGHGLDITASNLRSALSRNLKIDREQPGFSDFCLKGRRGVEPGDPALSLLYHALASPDVHPIVKNRAVRNSDYPTLKELDAIENYIYSLKPFVLPKRHGSLCIGVFAYEYRPAASSAHGYHADLVFSRTGLARVGTRPAVWDGPQRSFRPDQPKQNGIAVCPARYGAFIAKIYNNDTYLIPLVGRRDEQNDDNRDFRYPIHKLFPGGGCIKGVTINLKFKEFHRNEKLRKLHVVGPLEAAAGLDVNAHPFVRDSRNGGDLVSLVRRGASLLVVPKHRRTLVRTAAQHNPLSGISEPVRFEVPPKKGENRYLTSLQFTPKDGVTRTMPEYVNIRHLVHKPKGGSRFVIEDLKKLGSNFESKVADGDYEAVHFVDDSCDGSVTVAVAGMTKLGRTLPAYSLVTAPNFFPLTDQLEITNWARRSLINYQEHFAQGAPWPLCEGRNPANIELPRADDPRETAFDRDDETMTAVVSGLPRSRQRNAPDRYKRFYSHMTDAAADIFEPGWDVSLSGDDQGNYLAAYGLGSPFPEDAKLCAALSSFWPATAPDAARTFANQEGPSAMPLLDVELGYHRDHPLVKARKVKPSLGWDGEQGPFFEKIHGHRYVNAAALERSDYVSNALANTIDIRRTAAITGSEFIHRMDALRRCIEVLPPKDDWVSNTKLLLVTAEAVPDWTAVSANRAAGSLSGPGYVYIFAKFRGKATEFRKKPKPARDPSRNLYRVITTYECQISRDVVAFRAGSRRWKAVTLPPLDLRHNDAMLSRDLQQQQA
jgi:hypothetical protein